MIGNLGQQWEGDQTMFCAVPCELNTWTLPEGELMTKFQSRT